MSAAGTSPPVLEVENLQTEFHLRTVNVRAVDAVSFSVRSGECLGLVGESGCGKTTIGLSVMKLLPNVGHISGGEVRLNGRDLVPLAEPEMRKVRGNDIGMIFQDPMTSLNPTWTIGRQIAEPVRIHQGASKKEALDRAVEVLRLVGMPRPEERLQQYPHQLSGGLRQRVMIAMALACQPKLLIADEPTTALDVTIQAQILDLIDELRQSLDMAVLLITHDMGVIASRTDRVMVMYAGKIIEGASTGDLFDTMRHPYSEALFESIPRLNQDRRERLYSIPGLPPDLGRTLVGCRFLPRCRYGTEDCAKHEPLLSPGPGPSPSIDVAASGATGVGAFTPIETGEHLFACFHPVAATRSERLSFQRGGNQNITAAQPAIPNAAAATTPEELAAVGVSETPAAAQAAGGVSAGRERRRGRSGTSELRGRHPPGCAAARPCGEVVRRLRRGGAAALGRHSQGRVGRLVFRPPGGDLWARGRVGLRQDDDRAASGGARAPDKRCGQLRGRGDIGAQGGQAAPTPAGAAAHVPGPLRLARPQDASAVHHP